MQSWGFLSFINRIIELSPVWFHSMNTKLSIHNWMSYAGIVKTLYFVSCTCKLQQLILSCFMYFSASFQSILWETYNAVHKIICSCSSQCCGYALKSNTSLATLCLNEQIALQLFLLSKSKINVSSEHWSVTLKSWILNPTKKMYFENF